MTEPDGDAVRIASGTSTIKRKGAWRVVPRMHIATATGAVKLDFRAAQVPPAVDIEVRNATGAVELVLPRGASADISGLTDITGRVTSKVPEVDTGAGPHFTVHGVLGTGALWIAYRRKVLGLF